MSKTTNKPEVVAWRWRKPVVNDHGETVGGVWELGGAPAFLPWWTNEPLVRLSDYEALQAECDALRDKTRLTLGVGDGTGNLFVHGDYDSIKRVQELIFECEKLRKDADRYRPLLETVLREIPHRKWERGNAPGHCHSVPGVWDEDNGALAGKECAWCKVWNEAVSAMVPPKGGDT